MEDNTLKEVCFMIDEESYRTFELLAKQNNISVAQVVSYFINEGMRKFIEEHKDEK